MKKKIQRNFFLFKKIPADFVAFYCLYQGRIVAIGTQCIRKRFSDFAYHQYRLFVGQLTSQ